MMNKYDKKPASISISPFTSALFFALVSAAINADTYDKASPGINNIEKTHLADVEGSHADSNYKNKNQSKRLGSSDWNKTQIQLQHDVRIYPHSFKYEHGLPRKKF